MKTHHFWGNTWGKLELVLRRLEFLGLYSYLKIQPSLGRRSSSFQSILSGSSIKRLAKLRITGYFATIMLLFLSFATIMPIYNKPISVEATTGTPTANTLSYSATSTTASVRLNVTSKDGTFATSDENEKIKFTLSTNNATGYTLSIRAASNMDKVTLSNGSSDGVIGPLPDANGISATTYASSGSAGQAYNNTWGYIPSYYHSSENTNIYYRAPNTTTGETLRKTNTANSSNGIDNADSYSIGLGIRANYAKASGTYTSDNVLVLEYVANPVAYSISYADNTGDTIGNRPSNTGSQSTSATTIKLSSTIPTRTGYTFSKWCLGTVSNNGTTCTGTLFDAGGDFGIDQTISPNSATLYAVWTIKTYTVTIARNDDSYGITSPASLSLPYGTTLPTSGTTSASITLGNTTVTAAPTTQTSQYAYGFTNWTHGCGVAVTNNCTITANFTRTDVYTITWNPNNGSVSPTTTTRISGEQIGELPTPTRDGYDFLGWFTATSGGTQISETTTVTSNKTYYAQWKEKITTLAEITTMQEMTSKICAATPTPSASDGASTPQYQLKDTRDNKFYWVAKLADGNCWMTQNLDLDLSASTPLTPADTNVSTNYTPAVSTTTGNTFSSTNYTGENSWDGGNYYWKGTWNSSSQNSDLGYSYYSTYFSTNIADAGDAAEHYHVGNLYQWSAATAKTGNDLKSAAEATSSICPKGWRLPRSGNNTENKTFGFMLSKYGLTSSNTNQNIGKAPLYFVPAGRVHSGKLYDGAYYGNYWSSRAFANTDTSGAYDLRFDSTHVDPNLNRNRYVAQPLRCVAR